MLPHAIWSVKAETMAPKVERLNVPTTNLGEGPHWDAETQSLYYVDIVDQTINKYVPSTNKHTKASIGKNVSIIIPVKGENDQFVISYGREIILIKWDGEGDKITILKKLYEVDENTENVFNDGKCDPSGRLWTGTMGSAPKSGEPIPPAKGSFYSFENGKVTKHLTGIGISNGLAFNIKLNKFYYNDSYKGTLDQFDFDITKGAIANRKPIYTLFEKLDEENLTVLDGMTIDVDGNLWAAVFNQSRVLKINPQKPGVIAESVQLTARQITSVAFGGENLDELYVTTGRLTITGAPPVTPADGGLYRITGLNAKGLPGDRVVL